MELYDDENIGTVAAKQLLLLNENIKTVFDAFESENDFKLSTDGKRLRESRNIVFGVDDNEIYECDYVWDNFAEIAGLIIKKCEIFAAKTKIEWVDFGLDELKIETVIFEWFMKYIVPIIGEKGNRKFDIAKINGFVLKETSDGIGSNEGTFRHYAKNVGLTDNGCVSGLHCDESKWTVDICLGGNFKGGSLQFCVDPKRKDKKIITQHSIGSMLVFPGNMYHCVSPINVGQRINLVIFAN